MTDWKAIQRRLTELGYAPGPADGIAGRLTIAAVARFQADRKLDILYPGTVGPKTLAALDLDDAPEASVTLPWIAEARRWLGQHERRDAASLDKALGMDASETPWCGAFVRAVIAAALPSEPLPVNPLGARNWLKAGEALKGPQVGAIAVFWRGSLNGWAGHVGFVLGHDATHVHVLGGNQGDAVSIARIDKARLLGYRWPVTAQYPPTAPLATSTISASVTHNEA